MGIGWICSVFFCEGGHPTTWGMVPGPCGRPAEELQVPGLVMMNSTPVGVSMVS